MDERILLIRIYYKVLMRFNAIYTVSKYSTYNTQKKIWKRNESNKNNKKCINESHLIIFCLIFLIFVILYYYIFFYIAQQHNTLVSFQDKQHRTDVSIKVFGYIFHDIIMNIKWDKVLLVFCDIWEAKFRNNVQFTYLSYFIKEV